MTERHFMHNKTGASSKGTDSLDIDPAVLEKYLRQVPDEPLKHVEEIILPEPLPHISRTTHPEVVSPKRGPKSSEEWTNEVRKDWGNLDDVDKLGRSWLAYLPRVQKLAVSKYGGGLAGRGMALKQLLTQALIEARQCETDEKTHAI